jgi:hypothetical protein
MRLPDIPPVGQSTEPRMLPPSDQSSTQTASGGACSTRWNRLLGAAMVTSPTVVVPITCQLVSAGAVTLFWFGPKRNPVRPGRPGGALGQSWDWIYLPVLEGSKCSRGAHEQPCPDFCCSSSQARFLYPSNIGPFDCEGRSVRAGF